MNLYTSIYKYVKKVVVYHKKYKIYTCICESMFTSDIQNKSTFNRKLKFQASAMIRCFETYDENLRTNTQTEAQG